MARVPGRFRTKQLSELVWVELRHAATRHSSLTATGTHQSYREPTPTHSVNSAQCCYKSWTPAKDWAAEVAGGRASDPACSAWEEEILLVVRKTGFAPSSG